METALPWLSTVIILTLVSASFQNNRITSELSKVLYPVSVLQCLAEFVRCISSLSAHSVTDRHIFSPGNIFRGLRTYNPT